MLEEENTLPIEEQRITFDFPSETVHVKRK